MSYPKQKSTQERIEAQTHRYLVGLKKAGRQQIQELWESSKGVLRVGIRALYKRDFGVDNWSLPLAARRGTLARIDMMIRRVLDDFQADSISTANRYFREIYKQSVLRQAYMLDMLTPESYEVKLPKNRMFTEAAVTTYAGPDADTAWKVRWSAWLDTYHNALNSNLRLGALNDNDANAAEEEVDATRAGTPAYDTGTALDRVFLSQAVLLQAQSAQELATLNEDMDVEEIWQTSFSARVCDVCDDQKGLTRDEAEEDIPAHPNCECYWRLVPGEWAELLRSGTADDVDLAKWMDANGVVPSAMIIRNEDGEPAAKAIVSFDAWMAGNPKAIAAR